MNQLADSKKAFSKALRAVAMLPGLPHVLLCSEANAGYRDLFGGAQKVSRTFEALGVQRIIYYSTQWISVLGVMLQARPELQGIHVDENWYDLGNLDYRFQVDDVFAKKTQLALAEAKIPVSLVDYNGFPIDTGTIVAHRLLNMNVTSAMVSCHVYSDFDGVETLGGILRQTIEEDGIPTAVVVVSQLSSRFHREVYNLKDDKIANNDDEEWNRSILLALETGRHDDVRERVGAFAKDARADLGFKAYGLVRGVIGRESLRAVHTLSYAPLYGAGAACVMF